MSASRLLTVFAYDVRKDSVRARIADLLEERAVRVQLSVFEAWLDRAEAEAMARRLYMLMGPDDCLRVYRLGAAAN